MTGDDLARTAASLVGAPFRLHGRDPATGLDCIGVLAAALERSGKPAALPTGYPLHAREIGSDAAIAARCGMAATLDECRAGDVLIVRPAPCQLHLLIVTDRSRCVHAHAGLRRVVASPMPADWPVVSHWRLTPTS